MDTFWVGVMSTGDGFGHLWEVSSPLKSRLAYINQFININIVKK